MTLTPEIFALRYADLFKSLDPISAKNFVQYLIDEKTLLNINSKSVYGQYFDQIVMLEVASEVSKAALSRQTTDGTTGLISSRTVSESGYSVSYSNSNSSVSKDNPLGLDQYLLKAEELKKKCVLPFYLSD